MKRIQSLRMKVVVGCLTSAIMAAEVQPGLTATALGPSVDIVERFGADPLTAKDSQGKFLWFASGSWAWEPRGTVFSSKGPGNGSLLRLPGSSYTGTLSLRFRLEGKQGGARLLFAADPATGAHRWLEVAAGDPGRITLGQSGSLGNSIPGMIQTWRTAVAVGVWQEISLAVAGDKTVTVSLGGRKLFTAAAAPLVAGLVGFGSAGGSVAFDEFSFTADPDGEPCIECHAGQSGAPSVYTYWDGRWWDEHKGTPRTGTLAQQGGHGDPGNRAALGCVGETGCHDLRLPSPAEHRNGSRAGRWARSANAFHLRSGFITARPAWPWDVQVTFDNYCYTACHQGALLRNHRHADGNSLPVAGISQYGRHSTAPSGRGLPLPVDSDLTTKASLDVPDYVTCISCHDPHGTGTATSSNSNHMVRLEYDVSSTLCLACHH